MLGDGVGERWGAEGGDTAEGEAGGWWGVGWREREAERDGCRSIPTTSASCSLRDYTVAHTHTHTQRANDSWKGYGGIESFSRKRECDVNSKRGGTERENMGE